MEESVNLYPPAIGTKYEENYTLKPVKGTDGKVYSRKLIDGRRATTEAAGEIREYNKKKENEYLFVLAESGHIGKEPPIVQTYIEKEIEKTPIGRKYHYYRGEDTDKLIYYFRVPKKYMEGPLPEPIKTSAELLKKPEGPKVSWSEYKEVLDSHGLEVGEKDIVALIKEGRLDLEKNTIILDPDDLKNMVLESKRIIEVLREETDERKKAALTNTKAYIDSVLEMTRRVSGTVYVPERGLEDGRDIVIRTIEDLERKLIKNPGRPDEDRSRLDRLIDQHPEVYKDYITKELGTDPEKALEVLDKLKAARRLRYSTAKINRANKYYIRPHLDSERSKIKSFVKPTSRSSTVTLW